MIKNNKEFITYSSIIVFSYLLVAFTATANIQAQEDISSNSAESEEESSAPKKMSSLETVSYTHLTLPTIYSV